MRRILLTLPEDTTATKCGSCEHLTADVCPIFGPLAYATRVAKTPTRHPACLAAEAAAARMVEIAPEDAAGWVEYEEAIGVPNDNRVKVRVESAIRAHAEKAKP